mmetsp:Transcript_34235/g.61760  ORF Transcript_34235/g.61760 Transcript_34235/m.61760 type:complete len:234 (-) Transcript_34235:1689-2390(-)
MDHLVDHDLTEIEVVTVSMTIPSRSMRRGGGGQRLVSAGVACLLSRSALLIMVAVLVLLLSLDTLQGLITPLEDEGLGEEHPRHGDQGYQHKNQLQLSLPTEEPSLIVHGSRGQEHVDHDVVEIGDGPRNPLVDHEKAEVAEEAIQEEHLRDELADGGELVVEELVVKETHHNTHIHLRHTYKNGHLHLHTVQVRQLRLGSMPNRVEAERVRTVLAEDKGTTKRSTIATVNIR